MAGSSSPWSRPEPLSWSRPREACTSYLVHDPPIPARAETVAAEPARPSRTIEQVWPRAAHRMPSTLPDGRRIRPRVFLDAATVLVTAESGFEKADGLYAYDLGSGHARKLADVPTPKGASLFADGFAVGNDRIIWWTARKQEGKEIADIWSVPASGGTPAVVASPEMPPRSREGLITDLAVVPDGIAWSAGGTGVFRAPFTGGRPQPVDGTEGRHILSWPWVGTPGIRGAHAAPFQSLLNVETGERRDPGAVKGATVLACGVTRCVTKQSGSASAGVLSRAGEVQRELPLSEVAPQVLLRDRFLTAEGPGWTALYDASTGTAADLGVGSADGVRYLPGPDSRLLTFPRGDGYLVVDLAAIG